jgi:stearoyl-CoA desaturase (delta-9 desaturase)
LPFHRDTWWSKGLLLAFMILPLLATAYAITSLWSAFPWSHRIGWVEFGLLIGGWAITGLGISVGFHRLLTHRAFDARVPTRLLLLVAGTMALQGPAGDWAATHVRHHARADKEGDPHSPVGGFWHGHMGWLLRDRFVRSGPVHEKILSDPVARFVTKTWWIWAALGLLIPALLGSLLHRSLLGAIDGLVWGGLMRVFLGHHITWSVNSFCHSLGTRPFATQDESTNNWLIALIGWGEGWHNNHHAFPSASYIGMRWYQVDAGARLIQLLRFAGQVREVRQPSVAERRARARKAARRQPPNGGLLS